MVDHSSDSSGVGSKTPNLEDPRELDDSKSFVLLDKTTARTLREAGPRNRADQKFKLLLCTRQVLSVWFQGWTGESPASFEMNNKIDSFPGIILTDPPFQPPSGNTSLELLEYPAF